MNEETQHSDTEEKKPIIIRNSTDLQRLKLEKLMKNPDKPVIIPEKPKERGMPVVPDFVRNVMGSSAGAGSGEFHVYRHLRRKEYARQKYMKEKAEKEQLEEDYRQKLEENKRISEERTAKKRLKRLKKKQKQKEKHKKSKVFNEFSSEQQGEVSSSNEDSVKSDSAEDSKIESKCSDSNQETIETKQLCSNNKVETKNCEAFSRQNNGSDSKKSAKQECEEICKKTDEIS